VIFGILFKIKFLPAVTAFELFSTFFQPEALLGLQPRVAAQNVFSGEQALYQ
jgi:hypothetical protein